MMKLPDNLNTKFFIIFHPKRISLHEMWGLKFYFILIIFVRFLSYINIVGNYNIQKNMRRMKK